MEVSRRRFLKYCSLSAAAIGLDAVDLGLLAKALANPAGPSVIWLHGSSCTGCSVSFLNRISDVPGEPATVVDVVAGAVNLIFHATLMASAGDAAVAELRRVYEQGSYILVCEGGVPTAFGGGPCIVYSFDGREITYQEAVQTMSERAAVRISVGTCASFGGIPASMSNPTGVVGVAQLTGRPTINISGCPANPDWVVWAVVQLLLGNPIQLDEHSRPTALYNRTLAGGAAPALVHDKCPRNIYVNPGAPAEATGFTDCDGRCLIQLGCRGPNTKARCEACWNGIAGQGRWCIGVNAPCHGCVEPSFPGPDSFYKRYNPT
jgi:hydrogenase small subunit